MELFTTAMKFSDVLNAKYSLKNYDSVWMLIIALTILDPHEMQKLSKHSSLVTPDSSRY